MSEAIHTSPSSQPPSHYPHPCLTTPPCPASAELILLCVCELIISRKALLILHRSHSCAHLCSDSHHSLHLAAMANLVGSTELPEETTKTSSATKSLHKMETPITKQLYRHYKPTHMKPQEGEGKKKKKERQTEARFVYKGTT